MCTLIDELTSQDHDNTSYRYVPTTQRIHCIRTADISVPDKSGTEPEVGILSV